eukprot:16441562-Heterocapsa_arctica.AAC.1
MRHAQLQAERSPPGSSGGARTRQVGAAVTSTTFELHGPSERCSGQAPGPGGGARPLSATVLAYDHPLSNASKTTWHGMFFCQEPMLALLWRVPALAPQLERLTSPPQGSRVPIAILTALSGAHRRGPMPMAD